LIFHLPFPFIFSQSPIISLQSPIKKGDITSPFPYRKGENQSTGALLSYMLKLRKGISLYGEKGKKGRSICWSCSNRFGLGNKPISKEYALKVIEETNESWEKLVKRNIPAGELSLA